MKSKKSQYTPALVTLVSTLVVTNAINLIVYNVTKSKANENDSSSSMYATQRDGVKLTNNLLSIASEIVEDSYPNASVDELVSIGFKNDKLYFSCVASDDVTKIALITLDSASSDIDSTLKYISSLDNLKVDDFLLTVTYYTQEDLSSNQEESLRNKYDLEGPYKVEYAKDMTTNKNENLFLSYLNGNSYMSVTNATFETDGELNDSNAIKATSSRYENSYLYWLLYTICA